jgi:hypothetical protein
MGSKHSSLKQSKSKTSKNQGKAISSVGGCMPKKKN